MRRVAGVLALVILAACPAAAQAGGAVFTTSLSPLFRSNPEIVSGGPALAGDSVIWVRRTDPGYQVVTQPIAGGAPRRDSVRARFVGGGEGWFVVAASAERYAVSAYHEACFDEGCKYGNFAPQHVSLTTARVGEPPAVVRACRSADECAYTCPIATYVSGDVLATSECESPWEREVVVRDYGAGAPPAEKVFAGDRTDVAGDVLGLDSLSDDATRVIDWRTGEPIHAITPRVDAFSVQADGKVAYTRSAPSPGSWVAAWRSPEEPFDHPIEDAAYPRIADDQLIYRSTAPPYRVEIHRLDGTLVARLPAVVGREAPYDFDGERVAWMVRPCERGAVVVWDLAGDPPGLPPGPCPAPRIPAGSVRIDSAGRLRMTLRCPESPPLGCPGRIEAYARAARRPEGRTGIAYASYRIPPGAKRPRRFTRTYDGRLCAGDDGIVKVRIVMSVSTRQGGGGPGRQIKRTMPARAPASRTTPC